MFIFRSHKTIISAPARGWRLFFTLLTRIFLFSSLFIFIFASASRAYLYWQPTNGPWGGNVIPIVVSTSGAKYAGTSGSGIFKAAGDKWEWKTAGFSDPVIQITDLIVISGADHSSDTLFAATNGRAVWKSTNGGESWGDASLGLDDSNVYRLAYDPVSGYLFASTKLNGLKRSTDLGENWEPTSLTTSFEPYSLAVSSGDSEFGTLFVGTILSGIYKSTDGGSSFVNITVGYPALQNTLIYSISSPFSSPDVVFASKAGSVHKTADGGASWGVSQSFTGNCSDIEIDNVSPEVIYFSNSENADQGYIWKSTDSGDSWNSINVSGYNSGEPVFRLAIDPSDTSVVYVTNDVTGVLRSLNYGASFEVYNEGINGYPILAIHAASYEGKSVLYSACRGGVFISTNEGESWLRTNGFAPWHASGVNCITSDPSDRNNLFVGTTDRLLISTNEGTSWQSSLIVTGVAVFDVKVDPMSSEVIYVARKDGTNMFYRSTDGGTSFDVWDNQIVKEGAIKNILLTPSSEGTVLHIAGPRTTQITHCYRMAPGAASWESASLGFVTSNGYGSIPLARNFAGSDEIFLGGANYYLYKKDVYSNTWSKPVLFSRYIRSIATGATDPDKIYISLQSGDIYEISQGLGYSKSREMYNLPKMVVSDITESKPLNLVLDDISGSLFAGIPRRSVWRATIVSDLPPVKPTDFSGSAESSSDILWTWKNDAYNDARARIFDNVNTIIDTIEGSGQTAYKETGLSVNSGHSRYVKLFNASDMGSDPSNISRRYTLANAPLGLTAEAGQTYAVISWEANGNPGYTRYEVYISTEEAPPSYYHQYWEHIGTTTETEFNTIASKTLIPETAYWFRVRAMNGQAGDTGGGILTAFSDEIRIETDPMDPSLDILPPEIGQVRFDGRSYFKDPYGGDEIISRKPKLTATIKDKAPTGVTVEGVDKNSVIIRFNDYEFSVPSMSLTGDPTGEVYLDYEVPEVLGATDYICTIEAKDLAYKGGGVFGNKGTWEGEVKVMGDQVQVVGPTLAYPTPYKPLTQGDVTISYSLTTNANVSIFMYDVSGQIVMRRNYFSGSEGGKAGYNGIRWNGRSDISGGFVGNGIYVYKIISGGRVVGTGKLVVFE